MKPVSLFVGFIALISVGGELINKTLGAPYYIALVFWYIGMFFWHIIDFFHRISMLMNFDQWAGIVLALYILIAIFLILDGLFGHSTSWHSKHPEVYSRQQSR